MRIAEMHSHLNGLEFMLIRKPALLAEIRNIVNRVCAFSASSAHLRQQSTARTQIDSLEIVRQFEKLFRENAWGKYTDHPSTANISLRNREFALQSIEVSNVTKFEGDSREAGNFHSEFVKDRVAVGTQFGRYAFVSYNLFIKHLALYADDQIDVGIEILPMRNLRSQIGSGVPSFEQALKSIIQHGRSIPPVPLIIVGIEQSP